jgi:hypothetical protein
LTKDAAAIASEELEPITVAEVPPLEVVIVKAIASISQ